MSVNRELNALRAELAASEARAADLQKRLDTAHSRLRMAVGLLRDIDRGTDAIRNFLAGES